MKLASIVARLRRLPRRYAVFYGVLLLLAIGLGLFLGDAALPWEKGVAAREAAEKSVKAEHYAITGLWYGAWAALAVLVIIAISAPLGLRKLGASHPPNPTDSTPGRGRILLIAGAIFMIVAGLQMGPRLNNGLWDDEDYSVRRAIIGQYERGTDGEIMFREATWTHTLWAYRTPNNHVLFSILAKLAHTGYEPGDDPAKLHFNETRLRLPSMIAGLLGILSLGYLLHTLGYPRAALAAMFLMAIHPWFLRHGCEARGYPLTLFLGPLCLATLIKAVRLGLWRHWIAFGLLEFLLFYAYPGTIYLLLGFNVAALVVISRSTAPWTDRLTLGGRWFSSNCFAALPVVFLMAPLLPQMAAYLARDRSKGGWDLHWLLDNASYMASGMPWFRWQADNPVALQLSDHPLVSIPLLLVFYTLAAVGIVRLWIRSRAVRWILIALLLPYLLMLLHSKAGDALLYPWYSVPMLPSLILLVAVGVDSLLPRPASGRILTKAGLCASSLALLAYLLAVNDQSALQRDRSIEPQRESVLATRDGVLNPNSPDIAKNITVQFFQGTKGYDGTTYFIRNDNAAELRALMERSDREQKPLWVNLGMPELARQKGRTPNLMQLVDDPALFELQAPLWGLQHPCTRYIYRYLGNSHGSGNGVSPDAP